MGVPFIHRRSRIILSRNVDQGLSFDDFLLERFNLADLFANVLQALFLVCIVVADWVGVSYYTTETFPSLPSERKCSRPRVDYSKRE